MEKDEIRRYKADSARAMKEVRQRLFFKRWFQQGRTVGARAVQTTSLLVAITTLSAVTYA